MMAQEESKLLSRAQVAALFRVAPRTVLRWTKSGKLKPIRTAEGHPRYRENEIRAVLKEMDKPSSSTGSSGEAG
jgi:predicted site-specific integrase-resolvase